MNAPLNMAAFASQVCGFAPNKFPAPMTLRNTEDYAIAKRTKPSDMALIATIANTFNVSAIVAHTWLADMDIDGVADQIIDMSREAA